MKLLGFEIVRAKKGLPATLAPPFNSSGGGWFPIIREPFAGAWQKNLECRPETVLANGAVYSCITLIASDVGKMRFKLEHETSVGIYEETTSPSFSPVLNKPNHYQTHIDFKETWITSKLRTGNTFVLKERDNRGIVRRLYVLDPLRVQPLVASDGSIFYKLSSDRMSNLEEPSVTVPASEIIHDRMNCMFHPLLGVSPLFACALNAAVGLEIDRNSGNFFLNGAKISGIITAPGNIGDEQAKQVSDNFNDGYTGQNSGKVAVLGDGLKFTQLTMTSTDAQLIEQLKWSAMVVCSCFHVPEYMVGFGAPPAGANLEAETQRYYSQCLQSLIEKMEQLLDEGLAIPDKFDISLDIDALLRMDSATQMSVIDIGVKAAVLSPNDGRKRLNLPPVEGGESCYLQQQNFSLAALAKRDALPDPFIIDRPTSNPTPSVGGPPVAVDPSQGKQYTPEVLEGEFQIVRSIFAPLTVPALPVHIQKAA